MAEITRFPFVRHLRTNPTSHVRHLQRGRFVHDAPGAAFLFCPLTAALGSRRR